MQMLQSDWLSHYTLSAISVQWLDVVNKMATFFHFSEVLKERLETNGLIKFLRRLKKDIHGFLNLKTRNC